MTAPGDNPGQATECAGVSGDYYGVPLFLMQDYLRKLGGVEEPSLHFAGVYAGGAWTAHLEQAPWKALGSLRIGGARATFQGSQPTLDALLERLHTMTMRGGG